MAVATSLGPMSESAGSVAGTVEQPSSAALRFSRFARRTASNSVLHSLPSRRWRPSVVAAARGRSCLLGSLCRVAYRDPALLLESPTSRRSGRYPRLRSASPAQTLHRRHPVTDIVLIHGTSQGPAGWDLVTAALGGMGHRTHAVKLESSFDLTPDDYAHVVASQIELDGPPVVVAHSGGGLLLPATARLLGALRQVWLAAVVPNGETSLLDDLSTEPEMFNPDWLGVDPVDDLDVAKAFLFHDCPRPQLPWALTTLRRFVPSYAYSRPVQLTKEIPSIYVSCSLDRTLRPRWCVDAAAARLGVKAIVLPTGHCPHVSDPYKVARIISALEPARF